MSAPHLATDLRAEFDIAPGTIYLDAATYGLPPRRTTEAMLEAIEAWRTGRGRWIADWDMPAERSRGAFGELIGVPASRVSLQPASAVGVAVAAAAVAPGEEVVVAADEYQSVLYPFLVAAERGVVVRQVPFAEIPGAIGARTRVVAVSLVQMQTGAVADLPAIVERARTVGARIVADATQAAPFVSLAHVVDHVDVLVCSAYKHLLCPRGVAFMVLGAEPWPALRPTNANWKAADRPYERYFGGPLRLREGAAAYDVSLAWLDWVGANASLEALVAWRSAGELARVRALAAELATRLGLPDRGSTLVTAPVTDGEGLRAAAEAAALRISVRGSAMRLAPHVWTTPDDLDRAARVVAPFVDPG